MVTMYSMVLLTLIAHDVYTRRPLLLLNQAHVSSSTSLDASIIADPTPIRGRPILQTSRRQACVSRLYLRAPLYHVYSTTTHI